jgi:hypothetical protein
MGQVLQLLHVQGATARPGAPSSGEQRTAGADGTARKAAVMHTVARLRIVDGSLLQLTTDY